MLVATMRPVADDGVKDMCKMPPDLVHPSGFWFYLHQRISRSRVGVRWKIKLAAFNGFVMGDSLLHRSVFFFQWIVNGAGIIGMAAHNGQVGFADFSIGKRFLHGRLCVFIQGEKQYASGFPVETVHGINVLSDLISEHLHGKSGSVGGNRTAVHQ